MHARGGEGTAGHRAGCQLTRSPGADTPMTTLDALTGRISSLWRRLLELLDTRPSSLLHRPTVSAAVQLDQDEQRPGVVIGRRRVQVPPRVGSPLRATPTPAAAARPGPRRTGRKADRPVFGAKFLPERLIAPIFPATAARLTRRAPFLFVAEKNGLPHRSRELPPRGSRNAEHHAVAVGGVSHQDEHHYQRKLGKIPLAFVQCGPWQGRSYRPRFKAFSLGGEPDVLERVVSSG